MLICDLTSCLFLSFSLTNQNQEEDSSQYCLVEVSQVDGVRERILCNTDCPWKSLQDLRKVNNNNKQTNKQQNCKQTNPPLSSPQQSLTFSNLQRYFLRHREGGVTSIYMCNVDKEILREKAKYTEFVKSLFAESEDITKLSVVDF